MIEQKSSNILKTKVLILYEENSKHCGPKKSKTTPKLNQNQKLDLKKNSKYITVNLDFFLERGRAFPTLLALKVIQQHK